MQKNEKSYTFLLSQSSKSRIYIKRIEVSKSFLHFGIVGVFLVLGISTLAIGITGIVRNSALAETVAKTSPMAQLSAAPVTIDETAVLAQPAAASDYAIDSGGPEETDQASSEDSEIDNAIAVIRKTADPAYLPTMWAHLGKINNEFGFRRNPFGGRAYEFHPGMDIDGDRGDLVTAPANGTVIKAGWTGGYGNMIEIDHGNGLTTRYGHLSKIEVEVG